jgi:hypothetical protein
MADVRWLSDEELRAWKKLIAVVELLPGTLETQLQRDSGLSHFEYFTLAMLSEAPDRTLRMTALAAHTNSTLARLSHGRTSSHGWRSAAWSDGSRAPRTAAPPTRSSRRRAGGPCRRPRPATPPRSWPRSSTR